MRFLLVLAFAAVACAGTTLPRHHLRLADQFDESALDLPEYDADTELVIEQDEASVDAAPRNILLLWQVRRMARKLQKQMPCGWPDSGVPPLAPVRKTESTFHYETGMLETLNELFRLRIDGLDNFRVNKFKLNLIFKRITFDITFRNIKATAQKYDTNTLLDAMRQLGLTVQYEGDGSLEFGLRNLRIVGVLRYKIPVLWGSIKITSLKTQVSLEQCTSNISGLVGDGSANRMINDQIVRFVESGINNNQQAVSDLIEEFLVPKVNRRLKGNNFWTIVDMIVSSVAGESENDPIVTKCVPPADPWA